MKKLLITDKEHRERLIDEKFGLGEISSITSNIFDRFYDCDFPKDIKDYEVFDYLIDCLSDELIYNHDMWQILMFYQKPTEVNWEKAIEEYIDDLDDILNQLLA